MPTYNVKCSAVTLHPLDLSSFALRKSVDGSSYEEDHLGEFEQSIDSRNPLIRVSVRLSSTPVSYPIIYVALNSAKAE